MSPKETLEEAFRNGSQACGELALILASGRGLRPTIIKEVARGFGQASSQVLSILPREGVNASYKLQEVGMRGPSVGTQAEKDDFADPASVCETLVIAGRMDSQFTGQQAVELLAERGWRLVRDGQQ